MPAKFAFNVDDSIYGIVPNDFSYYLDDMHINKLFLCHFNHRKKKNIISKVGQYSARSQKEIEIKNQSFDNVKIF